MSTGRVERCRHTLTLNHGGRPRKSLRVVVRHPHAVQSTVQRKIGVAAAKIRFATGGHSEHTIRQHYCIIADPIRVKWGRKYSTISTVCKCESPCLSYSGTSLNGPSEMWTTSVQRTAQKAPFDLACV